MFIVIVIVNDWTLLQLDTLLITSMSCYSSESGGRSYGGMTAVAIVGRDNEPLYLRSNLCECNSTASSSSGCELPMAGGQQQGEGGTIPQRAAHVESRDGDDPIDPAIDEEKSSSSVLGRLKGAVGMNNASKKFAKEREGHNHNDRDSEDNTENDDECDDPFGFFENNSNLRNMIPTMSLTQQLVLHASLDRFEELAARSNIRWRMPGSSNSATAMWMGLLCEVEERWNVYGQIILCACVYVQTYIMT